MDTGRPIRHDLNPEDVSNYFNHFQKMCTHDRKETGRNFEVDKRILKQRTPDGAVTKFMTLNYGFVLLRQERRVYSLLDVEDMGSIGASCYFL
ncbi:hypothetical protein NIASO_09775 [Niabella soli DSM 19437]|uniref:Uncharacterized protein n=1 Tax=Niabella soli DSM 19437 TaxID=929713 RepID=W0F3F3_9BACT|nr:hypothetical protein NIASO_09775 [Niabella soli DSM 19437]